MDSVSCGVAKTIRIIGSKWTMLILRDLLVDTQRFNQLQRSLEGISPKTLSLRLSQLEKDGIVHKKIFAEVPPHVEYTLTPKGRSLGKIIDTIRSWGDHHQVA